MRNLNKHLSSIVVFVAVFCCSALYAQPQNVSGTILDGATGEPLLGATVVVEGTSAGVTVGLNGQFTLRATPDRTLVFSYVGYEDIRLSVAQVRENPTVVMNESTETIGDVLVVGYGVQKKASSVASIEQIDGAELLAGGNVTTVGEALQGKLNGVIAINKNGQPGNNSVELLIRGKSSWNGNNPLVLVDGVERNFNDVDINEIQSLSVLKDASATAVYGVRGANGVILLTTKRGTSADPKVNVSSNIGFKAPTRQVDWADYVTSMNVWNEAQANDNAWGMIPESTISAWEHAFATGNYGPYNDVFPQVDWYKELAKKVSLSQNYNVNVSGSSEFMRYFSSVGYQRDGDVYNIQKQPDFDPRYYYNRYNWRSNFDFDLTKSTQLSVDISGSVSYRNNNNNSGRNVIAFTVAAPTNAFPIKYSDGTWGDNNSEMNNIIASYASRGQRRFKTMNSWYDLKFRQKLDFLTKGLAFKAQYSYNTGSRTVSLIMPGEMGNIDNVNIRDRLAVRYLRTYDYSSPIVAQDGSVTYPYTEQRYFNSESPDELATTAVYYDNLEDYSRRQYYEFALNYDRSFGNHNVTALALVNRQIVESRNGADMNFPNYREDWVGRVTYNFKERYLMEVNMSYTGSDRFAPSNRFGFFPSFSAGYRLTEEPFMKEAKKWFTNFKVRYSWGQVGQDTYDAAARVLYRSIFVGTANSVQLGLNSNMNAPTIFNEGAAANLSAGWEVGTKQNLGLEMQFFNKLNITLDLFDEKRNDILSPARSLASWFGTGYPTLNMGKTKSHGFEAEAVWRDKIGKDFEYHVGLSVAASENRIIFKDDPDDPKEFPPHIQDKGKPIDWQSRYIATGNYGTIDDVFNHATPSMSGANAGKTIPGDFVLMDFDGNGIIDDNDRVINEKLNYPQATYSLNFGFDWKGFGFSALVYSPQGVWKNTFDYFYLDFPAGQIKAQPNTLDRWTYATANSEGVMRPSVHLAGNNQLNQAENTFKYENYSYIRLRNVQLSYTLPKKLLKKINVDNVRLSLSGSNLLTLSGVDKRLDPETSEQGAYPIVKSYTVGLNFSF